MAKGITPFRILLQRGDGRKFFWDQGIRYYLKDFDPFGYYKAATDDNLCNHHPFMIKEIMKIDDSDVEEWVVLRFFCKGSKASMKITAKKG